jgi:hypothetical protein
MGFRLILPDAIREVFAGAGGMKMAKLPIRNSLSGE